jgi:hypothetical protein
MKCHSLAARAATPITQISAAIWPSVLGVVLSVAFIITLCLITNNEQTAESVLANNAAVLVSAGGIVLKGCVGNLLGVALYHRLWLLLGVRKESKSGRDISGLRLKEVESQHLASRLAVGMLTQPAASLSWICGITGLLLTSALVPMLQFGLNIESSPTIHLRTVPLQHAQLDARMALVSGALGYPDNVAPNILRAATVALFGADNAFVYTKRNLTGIATIADVQYADVECNIDVRQGQVVGASDVSLFNIVCRAALTIPRMPTTTSLQSLSPEIILQDRNTTFTKAYVFSPL